MSWKLDGEQSKPLAGSLRAYGLGQMAGFGYTSVLAGHWVVLSVSVLLLVYFEAAAMLALKDVES